MARNEDISSLLDRGFRPRSTLAEWMRKNHAAFAQRIASQVPDWTALSAAFAEAGLTNRYGKPPRAEATRKLWRQINRDVIASRMERNPGHSASARAAPRRQPPEQVREISHPAGAPADPDNPAPKPKRKFGPASFYTDPPKGD